MSSRIQRLLDADQAIAWLDQFLDRDRIVATRLLESLILVEDSAFKDRLARLIRERVAKAAGCCAIFASREVHPASYFPANPDQRPDAVGGGAGVGSEGPVANLIRDIVRDIGPKALDHPSINIMRATKCREILLVDDLVGTGHRLKKFCNALYGHPTIRSWTSLGFLHFTGIVYAKTLRGERYVLKYSPVRSVIASRTIGSGRRWWSNQDRKEMASLCRGYAPMTTRPGLPLGIGEAFTCVVFQHKCPNTAPAILWASGRKWRGMFSDRPGFDFPVWEVQNHPDLNHQSVLQSVGQHRLSRSDWPKYISSGGRLRMMTLAAVAKRITKPGILSDILDVEQQLAERSLDECVKAGWLTWEHRLTSAGRIELENAKRLLLVEETHPPLKANFYFPKQFRGAKSSSSAGRQQ